MESTIKWDGECLGVCRDTVVRQMKDGRYAVINAKTRRIIKVTADLLHARRYNFAIHGQRLGE